MSLCSTHVPGYPNEPIQMDFNFNVDLEELAQENEAA